MYVCIYSFVYTRLLLGRKHAASQRGMETFCRGGGVRTARAVAERVLEGRRVARRVDGVESDRSAGGSQFADVRSYASRFESRRLLPARPPLVGRTFALDQKSFQQREETRLRRDVKVI